MRSFLARSFSALIAVGSIAAVVLLMIGIFGEIPRSPQAVGPTTTSPTPSRTTTLPVPPSSVSTPPSTLAPGSFPPTSPAAAPIPEIQVIVLNSTGVPGLATRVSDYLGSLGWQIGPPGNFLSPLEATTVYYPEGQEDAARQLAAAAPGTADAVAPVIPEVAPDVLTVVVGTDASEWEAPALPSAPTTSASPT